MTCGEKVHIDSLAVVRGPEIALVPYYWGLPPKVNSDKFDESTKKLGVYTNCQMGVMQDSLAINTVLDSVTRTALLNLAISI